MNLLSLPARAYVLLISLIGTIVGIFSLLGWESANMIRFICYFLVALVAAGLRVGVSSGSGAAMPVNILFVLIGIMELSLPETIIIGGVTTAIQCIQILKGPSRNFLTFFNVANIATATWISHFVYFHPSLRLSMADIPVRLVLAAAVFYLFNTFPVAAVISLTEHKSLRRIWRERYIWSLNFYVVGTAAAGLFSFVNRYLDWGYSMLALFFFYLLYKVYSMHLARIDKEMQHAEQMAALHLRTIEALALAIESKDETTHEHLQRVQVYALEVGRDLGMKDEQLEALRAAAILHDIGKLAVPEHIISKPGKLTPEEFDKMKIHPIVGAEILERVQFPYDVSPIVLAHHEKWDGSGYPYSVRGEDIPLGARILSAVDCLDALASDRQYRRALPLNEAMAVVERESGTSFDPRVVEILKKRYVELEELARAAIRNIAPPPRLSKDIKIDAGIAPAAGFEQTKRSIQAVSNGDPGEFINSIASARDEVQQLFEISQDIGKTLSLDEMLSVLSLRVKRMVTYDSLAVYIRRGDRLVPEYVCGENFRLFSSLQIPLGQGLSGWVADNNKAIVNGNPSVEPGYLNDPAKFSTLRSALAVPLEGKVGIVGVLALYRAEKDAFSRDNLRVMLAIASKVGITIDHLLRLKAAESNATTDFLTDLPNARSLFVHLDTELARRARSGESVTVLVTDLDGFKAVNDRFGHLEGNKLLKAVAQCLKLNCREYDYVARMGGDEFVLVLPGLKREDLHLRTSRISTMIADTARAVIGEDVVGISIGAVQAPEDGRDAETLLGEADRRMYKAKEARKEAIKTNQLQNLGRKDFGWRASTPTIVEHT
ncbi:HD domain-containing phosphohydrolase [Bryobacter aggregatus]|uniref:HD domain-containing phosphohydrolase n=1 Tax=Bryobacter aggregatus TaxID=360054 RepID=UPI00068E5AC3|nr:HD domain-containing phosphohydrolase [Bryobacter aggregatus]